MTGLFGDATKEQINLASSLAYIARLDMDFGGYPTSEEILEILFEEFQGKNREYATNFIKTKSQACDWVKDRFVERLVDLIYQSF